MEQLTKLQKEVEELENQISQKKKELASLKKQTPFKDKKLGGFIYSKLQALSKNMEESPLERKAKKLLDESRILCNKLDRCEKGNKKTDRLVAKAAELHMRIEDFNSAKVMGEGHYKMLDDRAAALKDFISNLRRPRTKEEEEKFQQLKDKIDNSLEVLASSNQAL